MIFLYLFILITVIYLLNRQNKRLKFTGAYAGFIFGMLLYYLIVPIIFIIFEDRIRTSTSWQFFQINNFIYSHGFSSWNAFYSIICIIIGFAFFNLAYHISFKRRVNIKNKNLVKNDLHFTENKILINIVSNAAITTFIIGSISFFIFIPAIGGIERMLSIAETLRQQNTAIIDFVNNRIAGLMIVPAALLPVSSLLFFYLILQRRKLFDILLFFISMLLSVLYLLFNAGRSPIIRFLIVFLYMLMSKKDKKAWRKIIFISIIALPILDFLDSIFVYFATNIWEVKEANFLLYLRQFSHPMQIQFNLSEIVDVYGYRFFKDFVTDILNLAPGINFELSYYNTSEFLRGWNWRTLGGTPNDVISYGYIQLGILGVAITLFLWGLIIGYIDRTLFKMPTSRSRDFIAVVVAVHVFSVVSAADIYPLIKYNPILIVLLLIFIIYSRKSKRFKREAIKNETVANY